MKITPLGKRILVKKIEEQERKTSGGIVLPESAKNDKVIRGMVLAVGRDENIEVKKGDEIIVSSFAGTEIEFRDEKLLLIKNSDLLAIIE